MPQPPPEEPDPQSRSGEPACLSLQESHRPTADFRLYVESRTRHLDELSRRHVRVCQLYSRTSTGHLQVLGKRVRANGEDGNPYALLAMESDTFGSHVRIKGKETGYYVCMDRRGKVLGKLDGRSRGCVFVEEVLENNYTAFMSAWHRGWYLGFTRKGRAQTGPRTHRTQREGHFMKRPPKGAGGEGQSPFRFTALTQRTKRALGPSSQRPVPSRCPSGAGAHAVPSSAGRGDGVPAGSSAALATPRRVGEQLGGRAQALPHIPAGLQWCTAPQP
ncbi:fibroblast growth factor 18-like [Chelonia mydas]|uniref:fibroblast growth factor 18-like n=1 Tax=Chelonia mydas TaxID=8469 RepID=UPI001CA9747E|nr:fibroblast growth factor 18-like [Chelonia mydas]